MNTNFAVATPESVLTSSSFDKELRDLLLYRTRLALVIVLLLVAGNFLFDRFLQIPATLPDAGLTVHEPKIRLAQIAIFLVGLGLTWLLQGSARQLQQLAFWIIASALVISTFMLASTATAEEPYLAAALALFIYAVFIPSPAHYPVMLGVLAVAAFVVSATVTYILVPDARTFWSDVGGVIGISELAALRNHIIVGTTGIMMLGFVAYVASRTLYRLRVKTHEASRLGNYVVEEELGSGGMGQVFRARHSLIRRPTAVKVMQASGEEEASAIRRFEREVQLSATLTHPNTITIYDFGHTPDNKFYYVMEFLDGLDLQELVDRFGPISSERTAYVIAQACSALSEAHERGIIHRDIKPGNIYLTHRGGLFDYVKVLDFGLAKQVTAPEAVSLTKTGMAVGTPRYISPEAVQGLEVDGRSDIYCLGAVMYFITTGRPVFDSTSSVELLIDHMKAIPTRPSSVTELPVHPDLESAIMRCLEKEPEKRFQSAAELEEALKGIPFSERWSQKRAHEWWELHGLATEGPPAAPSVDDDGMSNRGLSQFIYEP
jgi:serine/threonine-protein kinase